jgi:DNA-binding NarL/FixJ family response regulator
LIVDDHPLFRDGLAGLLATLPDIELVGAVGSTEELLAMLEEAGPDVVLMDLNLPGASGVEATTKVSQARPTTAVLVLTMVDDDSVFAALSAGARGYVLKGASAADITAALRTVAAGGAVFGAGIAIRLLARTPMRSLETTPDPAGGLTAREREVLALVSKGASNPQIARALGVSLKTVQNYVSRVLDKLQAADRTQAALRARGITPQAYRSGNHYSVDNGRL